MALHDTRRDAMNKGQERPPLDKHPL